MQGQSLPITFNKRVFAASFFVAICFFLAPARAKPSNVSPQLSLTNERPLEKRLLIPPSHLREFEKFSAYAKKYPSLFKRFEQMKNR